MRAGLSDQRQIGSVQNRLEVGPGGGFANTAADGHMHWPEAFLKFTVVVFGFGVTCLNASIDECPVERAQPHVITCAYTQRAGIAAIVITASDPAFGPLEIGQAGPVAPICGT